MPKTSASSSDVNPPVMAELYLPTMFTTANGRPICIRELRKVPKEWLHEVRDAALRLRVIPGGATDRYSASGKQKHSVFEDIGSECASNPQFAPLVAQIPFTGFVNAKGFMIFH
jgi:hypothetical protein